MSHADTGAEHLRRAKARLQIIEHCEEGHSQRQPHLPLLRHLPEQVLLLARSVSRPMSPVRRDSCPLTFSSIIGADRRYQQFGLAGLREYHRGPKISPLRVPPPLEALILRLRKQRRYGVRRRFYHFTAINEPTRYWVLKIYEHNSVKSGIAFIDEVRPCLPVAIQRIQTDHGSELRQQLHPALHDLGIALRRIRPGTPSRTGKSNVATVPMPTNSTDGLSSAPRPCSAPQSLRQMGV